MGEKPVKNDAGQLSLDQEAKRAAWKEHYERLLNVEFPWNPEDLSKESPVEGPSEPITFEKTTKAISKMASGKAAGPSGIVPEMLKPVGYSGAIEVRHLIEDIISEGRIPTDWQESNIVNLYKGNYRGLKLIDEVMKVLERVVESLIRQRVEIDEMQCGFMSGRGTTDAMFIVRQLQEKHLTANKPLYMAFVDLEKAFDRVPGCHLVGNAQAWNRRMAGALGPVHVHRREKQSKSRQWIQRGVWCCSWCSPRPCPQPASLHHCVRGSI